MRDLYVTDSAWSRFFNALSRVFKAIIRNDCLEHGDLQKKRLDGIMNVQSDEQAGVYNGIRGHLISNPDYSAHSV
jgi:hypothetical protein